MANENGKASPAEVRAFFEADGAPKVSARELIRLKKDTDGNELPDYDQLATGIGNGTLTY